MHNEFRNRKKKINRKYEPNGSFRTKKVEYLKMCRISLTTQWR